WEIGKNHRPEVGLLADPKAGLADLIEAVGGLLGADERAAAAERRDTIAERHRAQRRAAEASARKVWDARPIAVPRLMVELRDALPPGAIVCEEAITSSGALHRYLDFTEPGSIFGMRGGGLGPGLPSAIGVQLARPDRPVVAVLGDGAAMYTIQGLWTAAHYRLPVRFVVCANRSYRVLKLNMMRYVGPEGRPMPATDFDDPPIDFAGLARSLGLAAERVEEPDQLGPALARTFNQPGPALLEVVIDKAIRRAP
ncbi:MAG TPA: thiamine pyrophosphate-dependent enzyme, partial [Dehalococcoidia bacterium]|nr:thiamine pyrophosphate-dependent enzyme [Dehalococcoidia bacterium]